MSTPEPLVGRIRSGAWYRDPMLGSATFCWTDASGVPHEQRINALHRRDDLFLPPGVVISLAQMACSGDTPVRLSWGTKRFDTLRDKEVTAIEHRRNVLVLSVFAAQRAIVIGDAQNNQILQVSADTVAELLLEPALMGRPL